MNDKILAIMEEIDAMYAEGRERELDPTVIFKALSFFNLLLLEQTGGTPQ